MGGVEGISDLGLSRALPKFDFGISKLYRTWLERTLWCEQKTEIDHRSEATIGTDYRDSPVLLSLWSYVRDIRLI